MLREQQEKNVSEMNEFWQAHDLNTVAGEGKTYSDLAVLFPRVSFLVIFCMCRSSLV